jgi:O-antigen/teichoic acid export membrane protein
MKIGSQAVLLTISRLANYGLMLLAPLVLVRLMPVTDFGQYREFILYAGILYSLASFQINESLLYFVPAHPKSPWRIVRHTVGLSAVSSFIVTGAMIVLDFAMGGGLVGRYLLPLSLYALLLVNVDFWEFFFVSMRRTKSVMIYTAARLAARMLASIIAAAVFESIDAIIWSLVMVEALRFVLSVIWWRRLDRSAEEPEVPNFWGTLVRFCMPTGLTSVLAIARRNLITVAVAKLMGPVSLAYFAIGKYAEPVVVTLRNSLTTVILPEMVRRQDRSPDASLALWKRATVVNAIILFPVVALAVRYAHPLVVTAFGAAYEPAALLLQLYMIVVVRECFDFSPLLRSSGKTIGLVHSAVAGLVAGAIALYFLMPAAGLPGAMGAFVIASWVEALALAIASCRVHHLTVSNLVPWWSITRTALAAVVAYAAIVDSFWTTTLGLAGIVLASVVYLALFIGLILLMRVPEGFVLLSWVRKTGFAVAEQRGN